ncbi:hypothetical protein TNCV_2446531 [Trichonephila clavipes]|nr:hypothetical protein TNCV_2446531 [Trichonephila clavipes]
MDIRSLCLQIILRIIDFTQYRLPEDKNECRCIATNKLPASVRGIKALTRFRQFRRPTPNEIFLHPPPPLKHPSELITCGNSTTNRTAFASIIVAWRKFFAANSYFICSVPAPCVREEEGGENVERDEYPWRKKCVRIGKGRHKIQYLDSLRSSHRSIVRRQVFVPCFLRWSNCVPSLPPTPLSVENFINSPISVLTDEPTYGRGASLGNVGEEQT